MHTFQITLQNSRLNQQTLLEVAEDNSILDAAKEMGLNLPMPCRTGTCYACVGKLLMGALDQTEQLLLDDAQIADGYALLCQAYALSDCTIAIDWESGILEQHYQ
ncbi:ferredoxin [Leptolyngbya sp. Heron Island J]|uniref:2Fe-2S iron-sulfur cluster-binding protein n=1 Tax=Leptolyngbya sp. Heron Island J TaxID=1385935 RepID=UPI0003B9A299|nr:2Fe-2S iron-sulfur cluster-binding protein [Leptolyngbya sp. Heron Island J]ESA37429.1 ferredoxin [Leptolyngbya sp. Heron Island J]